ncbi:MAG TPA: transglycosylase domain-containing protein, partial [Clostridia bacterium]|nr:transglycosylase domain-containing protein [Clostridia bacterium]
VIIDLEEKKNRQNQTSIVYAYNDEGRAVEIARLHGRENRIWVDLDEMPENLIKAFIALEDKRFHSHSGVDWVRFTSVITKYNLNQGGSTITQQLIKNLTGDKDVTFFRKYKEILASLNLEEHYSKETILEAYLNTLYLGSGCYGVQTASETYFGKNAWELNLAESAVIAAITQYPYKYNPLVNIEENRKRQIYCLSQMLEQGIISQEEYDEAIEYEIILTNNEKYISNNTDKENKEEKIDIKNEYQSFYVDYVIDCVISELRKKEGLTRQQATEKIYYGGLKIYSAVDKNIQEELNDVYYNRVTFPKQKDTKEKPAVQSSMTIMDYSGRIVGIVGQAGQKNGDRCLNRAVSSPRQPGSTIKPLSGYSPAIELDLLTWSTMIRDHALMINGSPWPRNVNGTFGSGSNATVQYALEKSLNTVSARVINDFVGINTSLDFLKNKFHFSNVSDKDDRYLPPMAVGAMTYGMTTLEMTAAYASFGNGGKYYEPYCFYKVTNSDGSEVILEHKEHSEQILSPATADVMCELLQTVKTSTYGTGSNVRKFQIMCKTGTTDEDKDRWFAGGTPHYVATVWYGYDEPKRLHTTVNPAGRIFIEVFNRIHKNLEKKEFPKSGLTIEKQYCTKTGLIASPSCTSTKTGWYKTTNTPATCSSCSVATGLLGSLFNNSNNNNEDNDIENVVLNDNEIENGNEE